MKVNVNNIKAVATRTAGRSSLLLKKHSPEILMGVGIVGVVASTVLACKATLRVDEVLIESQEKIEKIKFAKENVGDDAYSEQDYKKDMTLTYFQTGVGFVKLYGPALTLGIASIGCILGAHRIMQKRNVAMLAAYKLVEQSFSDYRKRVVEELGEDKDRQFKYGLKKETITEEVVDENGKSKKVKKDVDTIDLNNFSEYSKFFDESSRNWCKTPEYNLAFLRGQQNYFNDRLKSRGHVFLNEVYDALDIPHTQAGALVGWVYDKDNGKDNYIDFGIYDYINNPGVKDFVNGYERNILLDFNVDGPIYNLI